VPQSILRFDATVATMPLMLRRIHRQLVLIVLPLLLVLAGCSSTPRLGSDGAELASTLTPEQAADITISAVGLVGTPYRYGGNTPDAGFDCSGLIVYIYQTRAGVASPRTVAKMQGWGRPVTLDALRSGDLVLFAQRNEVTHAGIYVGAGRFVHAPSTGGEVRLDQLNSRYWASQQVAFRRP
jgi:cell wall-associated NlpC family hydrolase